jgi:hypothetical protein
LIQIDVKDTLVQLRLDTEFLNADTSLHVARNEVTTMDKPLTANQKKKLKAKQKKQALKEAQNGDDVMMTDDHPDFQKADCSEPMEIEPTQAPDSDGLAALQLQSNESMDLESVSSSVLENEDGFEQCRAEQPPTLPSPHKNTFDRLPEDTGSVESSSQSFPKDTIPPPTFGDSLIEKLEPQDQDRQIRVKIADLGNACWVHKHFTNDIQTRQYRSPEVILGAKYDTSTDIWSLGCMIFELLTGEFLFDPKSGQKYSKDDDHLAQMIELLGHFPKHMTTAGKYCSEFFNRKGQLRHIHKLRFWKLEDVLYEKYRFSRNDSREISEFVLGLIEIAPPKRYEEFIQVYSA